MRFNWLIFAVLVCVTGTSSLFGQALDRVTPNTRALFEEGNYFEIQWSQVSPDLSGVGGALDPGGFGTGDLLQPYNMWAFALKTDIDCCTSVALVLDQPFGVNTLYPTIPTSGYSATSAFLDSNELSGVVRRKLGQGVSVYAGLRVQSSEATAAFPFGAALGLAGPYSVVADRDEGLGFMAGAAYEISKIKLKAALTYYSEISTNHATTETVGAVSTQTTTNLTTPRAINLELQSGIAKDTLAFGSIRWVDWSKFNISPPIFTSGVGVPLVNFNQDWTTYTGGIGRKINENFAIAAILSYTPQSRQVLTTLGPYDGRFTYGIAPSLTMGPMKVTVAVNWIELGDATNFAGTQFDNGDGFSTTVRVGYSF